MPWRCIRKLNEHIATSRTYRDLRSDLLLPIHSEVRNTLHWTCTWIKNISSPASAGWDVSHIHDVLTLSEHPKKLSQLSSLTKFFLHHSQKAESLTLSSGPNCLKNNLLLLKCQLPFDASTIMPWNQLLQNIQSRIPEEGNSSIKESVHWMFHQLQHKIYDSASLNVSVSSGTGIGNINLAIKPWILKGL